MIEIFLSALLAVDSSCAEEVLIEDAAALVFRHKWGKIDLSHDYDRLGVEAFHRLELSKEGSGKTHHFLKLNRIISESKVHPGSRIELMSVQKGHPPVFRTFGTTRNAMRNPLVVSRRGDCMIGHEKRSSSGYSFLEGYISKSSQSDSGASYQFSSTEQSNGIIEWPTPIMDH